MSCAACRGDDGPRKSVKVPLDENLPPRHAAELRTDGQDALLVLEVGLSKATDELVLQFAVENGCVLLTLDADFANVMRFPSERTQGIVRLNSHPATEERFRQSRDLLHNVDLTGRLAVVHDETIRIRR